MTLLLDNPNIAKRKLDLGSLRRVVETASQMVTETASPMVIETASSRVAETAPPMVTEAALGPLPFAAIDGAVYPGNPSWTTAGGRKAALSKWIDRIVIDRIVKEVAAPFQT